MVLVNSGGGHVHKNTVPFSYFLFLSSPFFNTFIFSSTLIFTTFAGSTVSKRHCPKSSSETLGFWEGYMHPLQEDGTHS